MADEIHWIDGRFNNTRAFAEGWGLFVLSHSRSRVERLDFPIGGGEPLFADDHHAQEHVRRLAAQGSAYHAEALRMHDLPAGAHVREFYERALRARKAA